LTIKITENLSSGDEETPTIDDDVAALLARLRKQSAAGLEALVNEALRRGHRVTGLTRDPAKLAARDGLQAKKASTTEVGAFADALKGHDAAILSVKWNENDVHRVLDALRKAGVKRSPIGRSIGIDVAKKERAALRTTIPLAKYRKIGFCAFVFRIEIDEKRRHALPRRDDHLALANRHSRGRRLRHADDALIRMESGLSDPSNARRPVWWR